MDPPRASERFCASDSDLTISSCDGVIFKVHRKHLEVHSDIFADAANATQPDNEAEEVVKLSESSAVLDLLFQYMYRQPQPDLKSVDFPIFAGLAEAAEKYVVYSALPAIAIKMKDSVVNYPLQVLDYGARHDHKELANEAARLSISLPLAQAISILAPDTTLLKWVNFYDTWHTNARNLLSFLLGLHHYTQNYLNDLVACIRDPKSCFTKRESLDTMARASGANAPWATATLGLLLDSVFMP